MVSESEDCSGDSLSQRDGSDDSDYEDAEEWPANEDHIRSDGDDEDFYNKQDPTQELPSGGDPLYQGSKINMKTFMIALLTFMLTHHLSGRCLQDLLALFALLLPEHNNVIDSLYLFFKYFEVYRSSVVRNYYCSNCMDTLNASDSVCGRCGPGVDVSFFVHISVIDQLRKLFKIPGFYENLSYPKTRVKTNVDAYEDLYDCALYKEALACFLNVGNWVTFLWNSDGFAVFKSSTFEIWPVYLSINELPPHLRFKKEYMILGGLWFGKGKPDPNVLLRPLYNELAILKQGVMVEIPSDENPVLYKAGLLCGTADSPARALFLRHKLFNGKFGCPKCLCRGEKSVGTKNVFVYPYAPNLVPRTDETQRRNLAAVQQTGKPQFGVKGPTIFQAMLMLSLVRSTSIDEMHNIFLGIMQAQLKLWFGKEYRNEPFSMYQCTAIVSEYLCSIKPPHFLQRVPQSLLKLAFWKASEFKAFFLLL